MVTMETGPSSESKEVHIQVISGKPISIKKYKWTLLRINKLFRDLSESLGIDGSSLHHFYTTTEKTVSFNVT